MKTNFTLSVLLLILTYTPLSAQCDFLSDNSGTSCDFATFICGKNLHELEDILPEFANVNGPSPLCPSGGEANNIKWYRFIPCDSTVRLKITPISCTTVDDNGSPVTGMQAGIYQDCSFTKLLACSDDGLTSEFELEGDNFKPGWQAYLFLDGKAGSVCNYTIEIITGIDTSAIEFEIDSTLVPEDGMVMGPDTVCSNSIVDYTFSLPTCNAYTGGGCIIDSLYEQGLICYEWSIEPDSGYVFVGDSTAPQITLEWTTPGSFIIDVDIHVDPNFLSCSEISGDGILECGNLLPLTVVVLPPTYTYLPIIYLCRGDSYTYCGETYTNNATVFCELDTCTFEVQEIIFQDPLYNYMGTQFVCAGSDCFFYNGIEYCTPGYYSILNPNAQCEEYNEFEIVDLFEVSLNTTASNDIDCIESVSELSAFIDLQGFYGNLEIVWTDGSGNQVGSSFNLNVNNGGSYTCVVSFPEYDNICPKESTVYISENTEELTATLEYQDIDCGNPETVVQYNANQNIINHQWEGPNGFYNTNANPTLTEGGTYQVILRAENGCEFSQEFDVQKNIQLPSAQFLPHDFWECQTESMVLQLEISNPDYIVSWNTENGLIQNEEQTQIEITQPGVYIATILDPFTQCEYKVSSIVENDPEILVDFELAATDIYCFGANDGILSIENIVGGVAPFTTTINGEHVENQLLDQLPPGSYEVVLADAKGCELIKSIEVIEFSDILLEIETEIEVIYQANETLNLSIEATSDMESIVWTDHNQQILGEGNAITINVSQNTEIIITVTDIYGCKKTKDIRVIIRLADDVFIPNIFSPNLDGLNDYFTVYSIPSPGEIVNLTIFDRWGNLIFYTTNTQLNNEEQGWNGMFKGKPSQSGAYVYAATVNNGRGKIETYHGSVTLVR